MSEKDTKEDSNSTDYERPTPFEAEKGDKCRILDAGNYELLFQDETYKLYHHIGCHTLFLFENYPSTYPERYVTAWNPETGDSKIARPLRDVDGTFYPMRDDVDKILKGEDAVTDIVDVDSIGDGIEVELRGLNYGDAPAIVILE